MPSSKKAPAKRARKKPDSKSAGQTQAGKTQAGKTQTDKTTSDKVQADKAQTDKAQAGNTQASGLGDAPDRFAKDGYVLVKGAVPQSLQIFFAHHFKILTQIGVMRMNDGQVERAHAAYGTPAVETLLEMFRPAMQQCTGMQLIPTYSYARVYLNGATLARHKDRPSCEVSASITLARKSDAEWPLHFQSRQGEDLSLDMAPGDLVVYAGADLEHWREPFQGEWQSQAFLHYVRADGPHADQKFDRRPCLGAPIETRKGEDGGEGA